MPEASKNNRGEIDIIFQSLPEDKEFTSGDTVLTWKEVRSDLTEQLLYLIKKLNLTEQGIKKIEVGTLNWFYERKKTRGQLILLNTMFAARLLRRR